LYFGELENNSRCYFAPERFCDSDFNYNLRDNKNLKKSMDIFSVACVISEIMMDGVPLFNRGGLIKYKTSNN
jgi:phosphoinositide-3-kinase regulatory subunit 4